MQRNYGRDTTGAEFDNQLIKLVRENPALYDVNHAQYRRNQVRIAIWDNIAFQLKSKSKFLQTKWKNIRYNYLQELKSQETGIINTNIRKRRFTEDLSFLDHTAQTYRMRKNGNGTEGAAKAPQMPGFNSDNDSSGYNNYGEAPNAYEVIEIEHSDDNLSDDEMNDPDDEELKIATPEATLSEAIVAASTGDNTSTQSRNTEPMPDVSIHPISAGGLTNRDADRQQTNSPHPTLVNGGRAMPTLSLANASPTHLTNVTTLLNGYAQVSAAGSTNGHMETKKFKSFDSETKHVPNRSMYDSNVYTVDDDYGSTEDYLTSVGPAGSYQAMPAPVLQNDNVNMSDSARRKAMPMSMPTLTPINDPVELYCLSLVDSLRSMSRSERERVKYEFAKILKDAKYTTES